MKNFKKMFYLLAIFLLFVIKSSLALSPEYFKKIPSGSECNAEKAIIAINGKKVPILYYPTCTNAPSGDATRILVVFFCQEDPQLAEKIRQEIQNWNLLLAVYEKKSNGSLEPCGFIYNSLFVNGINEIYDPGWQGVLFEKNTTYQVVLRRYIDRGGQKILIPIFQWQFQTGKD